MAFQRLMQQGRGINNASTMFGVQQLPTDNQIRNVLDRIDPEQLQQVYHAHARRHAHAYRCAPWPQASICAERRWVSSHQRSVSETTRRIAAMCSGPDAQQPPMICAPIAFQSAASSASREGL